MATYKKTSTGKWQAQVARGGFRKAKSFKTKQEARIWAARQEYLMSEGEIGSRTQTLREAFDRYARDVSPTKQGSRWEKIRLNKLADDKIGDMRLDKLSAADLADWRDRRIDLVSPGSVIREMGLISAVLSVASKEWGWIRGNPMSDVRRPKPPQARDRRVSDEELERLIFVAGSDLSTYQARAIHAFRFAIETAMRAGEIVGLTWDKVNVQERVALLERTKNGFPREVALSGEAIRLLDEMPKSDPVFNIGSRQLDALFRKVRDKAGIENLHFHDSRHEAITRLSKRLDVLSLARMVGHRNLNQLNDYYNESASDMAKRLD